MSKYKQTKRVMYRSCWENVFGTTTPSKKALGGGGGWGWLSPIIMRLTFHASTPWPRALTHISSIFCRKYKISERYKNMKILHFLEQKIWKPEFFFVEKMKIWKIVVVFLKNLNFFFSRIELSTFFLLLWKMFVVKISRKSFWVFLHI